MKNRKKILVVAAHPDDEILGSGGTVLRRIAAGDEAHSLVLGEGMTSRSRRRKDADPGQTRQLAAAHEAAARFMGFKKHWRHDLPDNRFDHVDLLDIVKLVEDVMLEVKPHVIYTHFENDLNLDHRLCFQAVLTACRPLPGATLREIYSFETPSATGWASPHGGGAAFSPNTFVDVSGFMEKKLEALALYRTETRPYPHPRSPEALRIIARRWGVMCGLEFAEVFILIRNIIK